MTSNPEDIWRSEAWVRHAQTLLDSFEHFLKRPLLARTGDAAGDAQALFNAPFVVVSHGTQDDPILNYGNAAALKLWEMPVGQFTSTPSLLTAEPDRREERAQMLRQARENGFFQNYHGVRISSSGKRFEIEGATVWRLIDHERRVGQAATFADWHFLDHE